MKSNSNMSIVMMITIAMVALAGASQVKHLNVSSDKVCSHQYPAGRHKIEIDGRYFLLLVPNRLPLSPAPIVVDTPGFSESPYYQVELSGIEEHLEALGWIAVVPFGTAPFGTTTCCPASATSEECEMGETLDKVNPCSFNAGGCCGIAAIRRAPDVEMARKVVASLETTMCGDKTNVFATGFSNGGMMTSRLGCEASDLFKGIAPVAGNIRLGGDFSACRLARPVAYTGLCGSVDNACYRDFDQISKDWAVRNKCDMSIEPVPSTTTATTKCYRFEKCEAPTEYCWFEGLDHEWPGHDRPDGTSPPQPDSNIDGTAFIFDRWSAMVDASSVSISNSKK